MIEQVYRFTAAEDKVIERVIQDEALHVNHMVLPKGEGFPEHVANAAVYMIVARGRLSIDLNGQGTHEYSGGSVLKIPQGTKMMGMNRQDEVLELIVVKLFTPQEK